MGAGEGGGAVQRNTCHLSVRAPPTANGRNGVAGGLPRAKGCEQGFNEALGIASASSATRQGDARRVRRRRRARDGLAGTFTRFVAPAARSYAKVAVCAQAAACHLLPRQRRCTSHLCAAPRRTLPIWSVSPSPSRYSPMNPTLPGLPILRLSLSVATAARRSFSLSSSAPAQTRKVENSV